MKTLRAGSGTTTAIELTAEAKAHLICDGMLPREADALIETVLALPEDRPVRDLGIFPRAGTRG